VAPVLVATAYAGSNNLPHKAIAALILSLALQIGVNYANDYSDGIRGTDTNRLGPARLVASALIPAHLVKRAANISFFIAIIFGSYLALTTSLWLFPIGFAALVAAWQYTGGKNPYGYLGFGEVSVFVFFGLVATIGSYFVQSEEIDLQITLYGVAMGSLACCILLLNNIRDRSTDLLSGKKTLSVRIGLLPSKALYTFFLFISLLIFLTGPALPFNFFILALAPFFLSLRALIKEGELVRALERTGKFQLLYALTLSVALILASL
jgi:1,4-dihydroxy-2-naphthoate octaprenyltransferase